MKTALVIVAVIVGLALAAPVMAATDFSKMSNDQLYQLKEQGVPPADRNNLESVWIMRVIQMTPAEREKYQVPYSDAEIKKMQQERSSPVAPE